MSFNEYTDFQKNSMPSPGFIYKYLSIPATGWSLKLIEYSLPPQNSKPCYPSAPALPNFFELIRQKFLMWILFLDFFLLLV